MRNNSAAIKVLIVTPVNRFSIIFYNFLKNLAKCITPIFLFASLDCSIKSLKPNEKLKSRKLADFLLRKYNLVFGCRKTLKAL